MIPYPDHEVAFINNLLLLLLGAPAITSCRGIRTAGQACLMTLKSDLTEATIDCRAVGDDPIKYEWTKQG